MREYGYINPKKDRPLDAVDLLCRIYAETDLRPTAVNCNNTTGEVTITFSVELDKDNKKKLDDWMDKFLKPTK